MKSDLSQFQFITRPTLSALEQAISIEDNVLYAALHEAIYVDGEGMASNWSAERVGKQVREFPWLSGAPQSPAVVREQPLFFAGEMIFPFRKSFSMFIPKCIGSVYFEPSPILKSFAYSRPFHPR